VVIRQSEEGIHNAEVRLNAALPETLEQYLQQLFQLRHTSPNRNSVAQASLIGLAMVDPEFARRTLKASHEKRIATMTVAMRHYQDKGQIRADEVPGLFAELAAELLNSIGDVSSRLLVTTDEWNRQLAAIAIRYLVNGAQSAGATDPAHST